MVESLAPSAARTALKDVTLKSPVANPGKIIAAPVNYTAHLEESRADTGINFGTHVRTIDEYGVFLKANSSLAMLNIMQAVIMNVGLAVMAVMAGFEAAAGRMGPGDVMAAVLIMISLYAPLNILGFAYREVRQSFIDMEEMLKVTRQSPQVADAPDAVPLPRPADARGASLVFEQVGFRHDSRANGLEDVSFIAPPGTTTALVGPSGSGKSTIVKLALRLLDPQEGRVLIDGLDARQVTQASLRAAVALVPQDVALFNDSLRTNIGFARPDADEAAIWAAAEAAELADFIRELPEGMETRVGERGHRPGPAGRPLRPDPGRGHQRPRQPYRGRHPEDAAKGARGPHHPGRRPPTIDHRRRRPDSGAEGRSHRRARRPP